MSGRPIRIAVIFEPGKKPRPVWFELDRHKYEVRETTYYWRDHMGNTPLHHFAVTSETGGNLYELVFNPLDQSWILHPHQTE